MKDTDIIAAIAPDAVSLMDKAIAEIKRLRQENATLTAERDALFVLTDRLTAEHDALRAERDEARRELCAARRELCRNEAIIRLQRNRVHRDSEDVVGLAKEIAVERGWDCFKENA